MCQPNSCQQGQIVVSRVTLPSPRLSAGERPGRTSAVRPAPLKGELENYRRHLVLLKRKKPLLYVTALMAFEPRLNNSQRIAAIIRQKTRQRPFLDRRVRNMLKNVRAKTISADPLVQRIREARVSNPRTFIRLVELVMPEMRPFGLAKRMARIREKSPRVFRRLVAILKKGA